MTDTIEPKTLEDWKAIAEGQMFQRDQYRAQYMQMVIKHNHFKQSAFIVLAQILRRLNEILEKTE